MSDRLMISVDPGVRRCGFAIFRGLNLEKAGYVDAEKQPKNQFIRTAWELHTAIWDELGRVAGPFDLFVEEMHSRAAKKSAWKHLMEISRMTGAFMAYMDNDLGGDAGLVSPNIWTGRLSKPDHQKRTLLSLTDPESGIINSAIESAKGSGCSEARSEIIDAVGIGLYQLGRV